MSSRAVSHFGTELELLIERFRAEYEMTYAELIGCMEIQKADILMEMADDNDDVVG